MAEYTVQNNVGIIVIDNPPVNSLGQGTRQAIYRYLSQAVKEDVSAIVLCGKGKNFSAGADINEFSVGSERESPSLVQLVEALENCNKPVIAALQGYALGGGLEVALSCHYRIAKSSAVVGFPEVQLGILPAAGGTQRFPRIVGLDVAMEWIASGKHYRADSVNETGLFDRIVPNNADVVNEAVHFARTVSQDSLFFRRVSSLPVKDHERAEEIAEKHLIKLNAKSRGKYAPIKCIEAVKSAAKIPFAEGLQKEKELFLYLVTSGQSKAMRYSFFSEKMVQKWSVPNTNISWKNSSIMPVRKGAVLGLGTMGRGIAINFLIAGIPVVVKEMNEPFLESGLKSVHAIIAKMEKVKVISKSQAAWMRDSITGTMSYSGLADVDLVIEAVFEDVPLKKEVFEALDKFCKPSAILASNTSQINIDTIASFTKRPEKVMGMHFFAPADRMKLLENVYGKETSKETIATCMDMGKKMRKVTVLVGNCYGFVANRMYFNYLQESEYLLEEGTYPSNIDKAQTNFGFAMGRFLVGDLSGNDVGYRVRMAKGITAKQQSPGASERVRDGKRYCPLADYLCERGRYGIKVGRGWYDYTNGVQTPSKEVRQIIDEYRKRNLIKPRRIDDEEVLERMLYILINEGFKVLDEGMASSPSDVDMVWIHGYAWPNHTGGPMFYAHTIGLPKLLRKMRFYYQKFGDRVPQWQPSAMLVRLVEEFGDPPLHQWMECSSASSSFAKSSSKL